MTSGPEQEPFSEAHLNSPEYRDRLLRKLNCLIAVLEVASSKVRRSLAGPDPDVERLMRIHRNLRETLEMCLKARRALERHEALPDGLPENLSRIAAEELVRDAEKATKPHSSEFESDEEHQRFTSLPAIGSEEISKVDLDELGRMLQG